MKAVSIVLRVIVTLAAIYGGWAMAAAHDQPAPHWLMLPFEALLAVVWAVLFWKLSSPLRGIWACLVLLSVILSLAWLASWLFPDGAADWTAPLIFLGMIVIWLLVLWFPPRKVMNVAKWGMHGLMWFIAAAQVTTIAMGLVYAPLLIQPPNGCCYGCWTEEHPLHYWIPLWLAQTLMLLLAGGGVVGWIAAMVKRLPVRWAILIIFGLLPFAGPGVGSLDLDAWRLPMLFGWVIGMIALLKLLTWGIGRECHVRASVVKQAKPAVAPQGLVDYER